MDFIEKYKPFFTPILMILSVLFWFTAWLIATEYIEWICLSFGYEVESERSIASIFSFLLSIFTFLVGLGSFIGIGVWGLKKYL